MNAAGMGSDEELSRSYLHPAFRPSAEATGIQYNLVRHDIVFLARLYAQGIDWKWIETHMVIEGVFLRRKVKALPIQISFGEGITHFWLSQKGGLYEGNPKELCTPVDLLDYPLPSLVSIKLAFKELLDH